MKPMTIVWLCVLVAAVLALYQVKYEVRDVKDQVSELEGELETEYKSLHVLRAEWAYLTHPERLKELNDKYLSLKPVDPVHMKDLQSATVREGDAEVVPTSGGTP